MPRHSGKDEFWIEPPKCQKRKFHLLLLILSSQKRIHCCFHAINRQKAKVVCSRFVNTNLLFLVGNTHTTWKFWLWFQGLSSDLWITCPNYRWCWTDGFVVLKQCWQISSFNTQSNHHLQKSYRMTAIKELHPPNISSTQLPWVGCMHACRLCCRHLYFSASRRLVTLW